MLPSCDADITASYDDYGGYGSCQPFGTLEDDKVVSEERTYGQAVHGGYLARVQDAKMPNSEAGPCTNDVRKGHGHTTSPSIVGR